MKYLKLFESIDTVQINLLDFCNFVGGMYKAVEYLNQFEKDSTSFKVTVNDQDIRVDNFSNFTVDDEYSKTKEDSESISFNGNRNYSYGFLKQTDQRFVLPPKIIFTFYNANIKDELISSYIYSLKYNIF